MRTTPNRNYRSVSFPGGYLAADLSLRATSLGVASSHVFRAAARRAELYLVLGAAEMVDRSYSGAMKVMGGRGERSTVRLKTSGRP